ncbi:MAG: tetratricopeptide repeat protein [Bacteroidetes bacterium]|nr:tetratricopeptide repeat protein [Bacteroidota bacterium]
MFLFVALLITVNSAYSQQTVEEYIEKLKTPNLHDSAKIKIELNLSDLYSDNDIDKAFKYAKHAYGMAKRLNRKVAIIECLNQVGTLYYRISKYDSSIYYLQSALSDAKAYNVEIKIADILNNLGNNYLDLSQYNLALDYYTKALVYMRKHNNLKSQAFTMANIGLIYHVRQQYDKSLEFHLKSLELLRVLKSSNEDMCIAYIEIAEVLTNKKNIKLAEMYVDSAESFIKSDNEYYSSCLVNRLKGDLAVEEKDYLNAILYYKKSIELAYKISYERGAIDTKNKLADAYYLKGDYVSANKIAMESNNASYSINITEQMAESELILSKISAKLKDFEASYTHLDKYRILTDTLHNIEKNNFLAEMQTRFATQEKEFENDVLKKTAASKDELIKTQSKFLYVVVLASILLLAFSIYEFIQYRKKQQLSNELLRLNEDILKQKDELELQAIELSNSPKLLIWLRNRLQSWMY